MRNIWVNFHCQLQGQDGVGGDKGEDGDPGQPVGKKPYYFSSSSIATYIFKRHLKMVTLSQLKLIVYFVYALLKSMPSSAYELVPLLIIYFS